jgi:AcrR family transcriptional regulator
MRGWTATVQHVSMPGMTMEEKRSRILETAIELAEKGGFDNVRLRDVAAQAEVALGTLYKRFPSKESILLAALELEAEKLEKKLSKSPVEGATPTERVIAYFDLASRQLFRKPNLGRAVLRALTSGDETLTGDVASFHQRVTNMIVAASRGSLITSIVPEPSNEELMMAFIMQQQWFAALVGWMGGLINRAMVIDQLQLTLAVVLRGLEKD